MRVVFERVRVDLGRHPVLRSVDLVAGSGRFLGFVGSNGSGKSTLLRTLYRAVPPTEGRVLLGDQDVWRCGRREVARSVAVMTQETSSEFDLTVLDVVLLGRVPYQRGLGGHSATDLETAWNALTTVGAERLAHRLIGQLSGGQRQRVMLARALASDAPVLVLDEPTNHLDISFQLDLMRLVAGLGRTVIAALHDLNLAAAYCDDIAVLHEGRVVATGEAAEVLVPEVIREVFTVDVDRLEHPRTGRPLLAFAPP
uniref:ABC transporter ATP-binding protein n=1 Tax=Actinoalloteichus spitiensis TaxID=252394 RepID=UPI0004750070